MKQSKKMEHVLKPSKESMSLQKSKLNKIQKGDNKWKTNYRFL